ncbi:SDR family oxidoreductase [Nocardia sp. NBC_00565]|uniref:SDR family NAD(P)-dependent oxidoreductase n=1 Tax=Nocardia sp. NBC_00565 TaxID=2975993 RepID=UPI002E805ACA|nr:SDR family oxidoreductase [Nocardia sp. NBC_00565]WUC01915.1 SDR family oxidoreductase [Nocardia sp. NBC_00565]
MSRVAVVTGGHSGIGRATARLLDKQGVRVAVLDRDGTPPVDVSDPAGVEAAVAGVRQTLGSVNIVVNAAGIAAGGLPTDDHYIETWQNTLAVNLTGAMLVVRACLPDLLANGSGRIVNVASTEAFGAGRFSSPYTVAKHGLAGFTKALAVDYGRYGLTANCVCPGATLTGMTEAIPEADRMVFARRRIPAGRYGRPEEIAHVIVALTAKDASFINGAVIPVDGGMTAQTR